MKLDSLSNVAPLLDLAIMAHEKRDLEETFSLVNMHFEVKQGQKLFQSLQIKSNYDRIWHPGDFPELVLWEMIKNWRLQLPLYVVFPDLWEAFPSTRWISDLGSFDYCSGTPFYPHQGSTIIALYRLEKTANWIESLVAEGSLGVTGRDSGSTGIFPTLFSEFFEDFEDWQSVDEIKDLLFGAIENGLQKLKPTWREDLCHNKPELLFRRLLIHLFQQRYGPMDPYQQIETMHSRHEEGAYLSMLAIENILQQNTDFAKYSDLIHAFTGGKLRPTDTASWLEALRMSIDRGKVLFEM